MVLRDVTLLMKQCTGAVLILWDELPDLGSAGSDDPVVYATQALTLLGLHALGTPIQTPKKQFVMCTATSIPSKEDGGRPY